MTSQMMPPQGQPMQPQPQAPMPQAQQQAAQQQINPSKLDFEEPELPPEEVEAEIEASLDNLDDENKELLALYLTPEFAQLMRAFMGDPFGNVFDRLADKEKILIPLNRADVMDEGGGQDTLAGGAENDKMYPLTNEGIKQGFDDLSRRMDNDEVQADSYFGAGWKDKRSGASVHEGASEERLRSTFEGLKKDGTIGPKADFDTWKSNLSQDIDLEKAQKKLQSNPDYRGKETPIIGRFTDKSSGGDELLR